MPYIITTYGGRQAMPEFTAAQRELLDAGFRITVGSVDYRGMSGVIIPEYHEPTRRAVATLDEARKMVKVERVRQTRSLVQEGKGADALMARMVTESGGKVGPLPDGTVIEVEQVDVARLAGKGAGSALGTEAEIIAAYNAAQEA